MADRMARRVFGSVRATPEEVAAAMPGDALLPRPDVVMDRGFTLPAAPAQVWPWLEQLGKARAGWYLPRSVERLVPAPRRALRHVDPRWRLQVGDVIPDWGGADASFTVAQLDPTSALVHTSRRGRMDLTWAIALRPLGRETTRVLLRLRLTGIARPWLAETGGELMDQLTVAGLAAGMAERVGTVQGPHKVPPAP